MRTIGLDRDAYAFCGELNDGWTIARCQDSLGGGPREVVQAAPLFFGQDLMIVVVVGEALTLDVALLAQFLQLLGGVVAVRHDDLALLGGHQIKSGEPPVRVQALRWF
jgi:hypothetical protein